MANKIKIKRGLSSNINKLQLEAGELAITTDTTELYAGDKNNNAVKINNNTTYTLTKNGSSIILTGSDGSTQSVADSNTTYNAATQSANGLMSSTDKAKLDGIATGANKITVDTALSSSSTNPVQNKVINAALANKANASTTVSTSNIVTAFDIEATLDNNKIYNANAVLEFANLVGTELSENYATKSEVPTKTSQLTNDSGFKTTDNNTTYTISKSGSTITLTGSDGKTSTVTDANTTYSNAGLGNGYGTCSTAATTVAKTATLSGYALSTQGRVSVKFDEDVPAAATLNINSKGAKAIYYKGAAITDNIILGGDIVTFIYNGTQYEIVNIYRENDGQELVAGQHISIVDNIITVNDLGDLGQLKTTKKDFVVNAINNLVEEDAIIRDEMTASTLNLNNSVESLNTRVSILESDVETSVDKLANTLMTINETNGIDVGTEINTLQTKIDGNQVNIYSGDTNYLQIAPDTSTGEVKTKCEKFQTKQILCGYHERKEMLIGTEKRTGFFYVEGGSN